MKVPPLIIDRSDLPAPSCRHLTQCLPLQSPFNQPLTSAGSSHASTLRDLCQQMLLSSCKCSSLTDHILGKVDQQYDRKSIIV
jgi:hypothetical protein